MVYSFTLSLDHLVGEREQRWRQFKPEHFGGF
jgi:hypothetical protein